MPFRGPSDDAIDIGRKRCAFKTLRDQFGGVGGAVGGGDDGDVVARAGATVFAAEAHEGGHIRRRRGKRNFDGGELVIEVLLLKTDVLHVHVLALFDVHLGSADDLAVAVDRLALGDISQRHFVPGGHGVLYF